MKRTKINKISARDYAAKVLLEVALIGETAPFWKAQDTAAQKSSLKELKIRIRSLSSCLERMMIKLHGVEKIPNVPITLIKSPAACTFSALIMHGIVFNRFRGEWWRSNGAATRKDYKTLPVVSR